jgi:protein-S-isoprenylcysteine O-methyltransferase Ste14
MTVGFTARVTWCSSERARAKAFLQTLVFLILLGFALFGAAGRFDFAEFWVYIAIVAAISAVSLAILDADLIAERMRPGGRRVGWHFLPITAVLFLHWAFAGLDRGRLHIGDTIPLALQVAGLIGFAAGWALPVWAMQVNRYFSSIPRIQAERGHRLVSAGPYRWVRHPGYAGALVVAVSSPLALGSWLSAFIVPVAAGLLAWRIVVEEKLLIRELPGYAEYARQVRYRLIPGLW